MQPVNEPGNRRRRGLAAAAIVLGGVAVTQVGPVLGTGASCATESLPRINAWTLVVDPAGLVIAANLSDETGKVIVSGPDRLRKYDSPGMFLVTGVNSSGTVTGNVVDDVDSHAGNRGYVIDGGTLIQLGVPAGTRNVSAGGINDTGDVVGDARQNGSSNVFLAVVWRHGRWDRPELLPTPAGEQSAAFGIGADGTIVGSVGNLPYRWKPDGTAGPLPTPTALAGGIAVKVTGDWAAGPIGFVEHSSMTAGGRRAARPPLTWARWNLRTDKVTTLRYGDDPDSVRLAGLLSDGTVVLNGETSPTLWRGSGTTQLQLPSGFQYWWVSGVSAHGTLVGFVNHGMFTTATAIRAMCR